MLRFTTNRPKPPKATASKVKLVYIKILLYSSYANIVLPLLSAAAIMVLSEISGRKA